MSRFKLKENKFGKHDTILLYDESTDYAAEVALQGSTLLNFMVPINDVPFNIIDGFATPQEFEAARGARCWIMAPFANRIPNGEYLFEGKKYKLKPIPPRENVIHGFAAYQFFKINNVESSDSFIEVELLCDTIRPGKFEGYPFSLNILTKIKLEEGKISFSIIAENIGNEPLPFHSGWHPYFKTSLAGIDNLILELNAKEIIKLDDNFIPLPSENAYEKLNHFPLKDFGNYKSDEERLIGKKVLNDCYFQLEQDENNLSVSSITDLSTGIKIEVFQEEGVTLLFSGEGLAQRERKSIAIEPMQFITNAFNREELKEKIKVMPGEKSVFNFGVRVKNI